LGLLAKQDLQLRQESKLLVIRADGVANTPIHLAIGERDIANTGSNRIRRALLSEGRLGKKDQGQDIPRGWVMSVGGHDGDGVMAIWPRDRQARQYKREEVYHNRQHAAVDVGWGGKREEKAEAQDEEARHTNARQSLGQWAVPLDT
jgi:hypothetical protein